MYWKQTNMFLYDMEDSLRDEYNKTLSGLKRIKKDYEAELKEKNEKWSQEIQNLESKKDFIKNL